MALPVSGPTSFFVSWWYSPDTKLGIYFNDFGINAASNTLSTLTTNGIDSNNGMGASVEENYHYENLITNHPVENNNAISDHIIPQPNIITITGIITSIVALPLSGIISFSQLGNATQLLIQMAQATKGLSLQTGLLFGKEYKIYNNLAVQSLDIPRTNEYGRSSIKFTIVFKELIITSTADTVVTTGFSNATPATTDLPT